MKNKPLILALTSVAVLLCGCATSPTSAQLAVPPPTPIYQPLSDQQLDQLLGPVALYPDPLLAVLLPAATLPTQIVMADRYVNGGGDPNLIEQQPWDSSIQALAHYPTVLKYMDDNLAWTTALGQAFLSQQQDVMNSVQRLRLSAQNFGNLASTPQEQVVEDDGDVEILPTDPNVIYVPVYQPEYVYYQGGYACGFGASFSIGGWLDCDFDWHNHNLFHWDHDHPRPANWWHERPEQRTSWMSHQGAVWHPEDRRGQAPAVHGDRGWGAPAPHAPAPPERHDNHDNVAHRPAPQEQPHPAPEPSRAPEPRPEPVHEQPSIHAATPPPAPRPVFNGAFGGNDSARETRDFSNRGQQSMQSVTHSAPVHSAPPASRPAPSGGGGHSGGGHH